jgi:Gamma-butyrobetaine hydroxylase-like, N-terminal
MREAVVTGADLELTVGGRRLRFPAVWLRNNCLCAECQDPGSGQKLKDITEIPNDLGVAASADAGESVLVFDNTRVLHAPTAFGRCRPARRAGTCKAVTPT